MLRKSQAESHKGSHIETYLNQSQKSEIHLLGVSSRFLLRLSDVSVLTYNCTALMLYFESKRSESLRTRTINGLPPLRFAHLTQVFQY